MTTKAEWEKAKADNHANYPKTFEVDGFYTHATGVPSRLIETANHFYQVCYLLSSTNLCLPLFMAHSFTSLKADLYQDIKRSLALSGCLNGKFP